MIMLKNFLRFVITLAVIAGIGYGGYLFAMHTIDTHSFVAIDEDASPDDYFLLEITSGMRASEVIEILYEQELVRHEFIARMLVRSRGWGRIQIGQYRVHAGMSLEEMFDLFENQEDYVDICELYICVIIPEGWRLDQIARLFANHEEIEMDISRRRLLELWEDPDFLAELIEEYWFLTDAILNPLLYYPLEGYITPIRHQIPRDETDPRVITRAILSITEQILRPVRTEMEEHELTVHEILSFAAVIEGETQRVDQMNDVAGVFQNRLAMHEPWGTDVSAQYLFPGEQQEFVSYDMTQVYSPFNTYIYPGVPIGPMNSPSVAAIRAAMNPTDHDYVFFMTDMFGCAGEVGEKLYAFTNAEHEHNRNTYLNPALHNDGVCP